MKKINWISVSQWTVGIVFILIVLLIACLPYLAIQPENIFTKFCTIILCLIVLFLEVIFISLSIVNIKKTQNG